jgi:hypothetical protein
MDGEGNGFSVCETKYRDREKDIPGYVRLSRKTIERYEYIDETYEKEIFAYFNLSTKQLFEIYGYKFFYDTEIRSNVLALKPDNDSRDIFFYDLGINEPINFNGEPFITNGYSIWMDTLGTNYWENYFKPEPAYVGIQVNGHNSWNESVIYNSVTHSFVTHNGEYVFNLGDYKDRDAGRVIAKDGTQLQLTKPLEDAKKQEYAMKVAAENYKRDFNLILERMNKYKRI